MARQPKAFTAQTREARARPPSRYALRAASGVHEEPRQPKRNGRRALEFIILTAARVGEVMGARWGEIDTTPLYGPCRLIE